jgi:hypothetical protein
MAVTVDETEVVFSGEASERVHEEASERLLDLARMAEHQMSVVETARLGLDRLNEDASRGVDLMSRALHRSKCPRTGVIEQCAPPLGE